MAIHQILNKNEEIIIAPKFDSTGKFKLTIPNSSLKDFNTLSLYVTYKDNNIDLESNHITHTISTGGILSFGHILKEVNFKTTNELFKSQIVPRTGPWEVNVVDSRPKGNHWYVKAQSSGLFLNNNKDKPLKGNLFFRDSDGKDENIQKNDAVQIASHTKESDQNEITDIVKNWNSNSGILLFINNINSTGKYSGDIVWSLLDTP